MKDLPGYSSQTKNEIIGWKYIQRFFFSFFPIFKNPSVFAHGHIHFQRSETFSSRSKLSPENETKHSFLRFEPAFESSNNFLFLDTERSIQKLKEILFSFRSQHCQHVLDFFYPRKLPRNARGNIIRGKSIPSKNNLRGITMGRGPIWGIHSLTFILSC